MRRALFPVSFDPITKGHEDIIMRGLNLFDEIVIGVGINSEKKYMFSSEKRINFIKKLFMKSNKISVTSYKGLTVDFCKTINANYILRGLRNPGDFEFEKAIAHTNRKLSGIETIFLLTSVETSFISSGIVREIILNNGDYRSLVPNSVKL